MGFSDAIPLNKVANQACVNNLWASEMKQTIANMSLLSIRVPLTDKSSTKSNNLYERYEGVNHLLNLVANDRVVT